MSLTPALFHSDIADGPTPTLLQPSHWNDVTDLLEELFDGASGSRSAALASLALTTPLPATSGGTGLSTFAVGDLFYASTTSALSRLAAVAAGAHLRSTGVGSAPAWSSTTWPNAATTGDLVYASGANAFAALADVAAGSVLASGGVGAAPAWSSTPTVARLGVGSISPPTDAVHIVIAQNANTGVRIANSNAGITAQASVVVANDAAFAAFGLTSSGYSGFPANTGYFATQSGITGGLLFRTEGANSITFQTNSASRWIMLGSGTLQPQNGAALGDSTHSVGALYNGHIFMDATSAGSGSPLLKIRNLVDNADMPIRASAVYVSASAFMMRSTASWTNGAAAQTGTLTNAPAAGNPTKWIPVDDNGTTRYIPAW